MTDATSSLEIVEYKIETVLKMVKMCLRIDAANALPSIEFHGETLGQTVGIQPPLYLVLNELDEIRDLIKAIAVKGSPN